MVRGWVGVCQRNTHKDTSCADKSAHITDGTGPTTWVGYSKARLSFPFLNTFIQAHTTPSLLLFLPPCLLLKCDPKCCSERQAPCWRATRQYISKIGQHRHTYIHTQTEKNRERRERMREEGEGEQLSRALHMAWEGTHITLTGTTQKWSERERAISFRIS